MKARLSGGHFRMINEKLYTCTYAILSVLICVVMLVVSFDVHCSRAPMADERD